MSAKQAKETAKQFLIDRNAETVKQWARERAGDDAEEEKKLLCLVRYYVRRPGLIDANRSR